MFTLFQFKVKKIFLGFYKLISFLNKFLIDLKIINKNFISITSFSILYIFFKEIKKIINKKYFEIQVIVQIIKAMIARKTKF
jgi:hypothetical protein